MMTPNAEAEKGDPPLHSGQTTARPEETADLFKIAAILDNEMNGADLEEPQDGKQAAP